MCTKNGRKRKKRGARRQANGKGEGKRALTEGRAIWIMKCVTASAAATDWPRLTFDINCDDDFFNNVPNWIQISWLIDWALCKWLSQPPRVTVMTSKRASKLTTDTSMSIEVVYWTVRYPKIEHNMQTFWHCIATNVLLQIF